MAKVDISEILAKIPGLEAKEKGTTEPYPSQATTLRQSEANYPALVPFETKGRYKLLNRYSTMKTNYKGSIETAKDNYDKLPFGPNTKRAFRAGMEAEPYKAFDGKLVVSHEKKWANRWMKGVSR